MSELEQQLQARLLHRTTRRLGLTEVGERYLQRCRSILDEVDQAAAEARGAHLKPSGRLRVHTMTGLGLQHVTGLVARYSALYPEVVVELTLSQRNPDPIEDGQDVVLTFARELPDSQRIAQSLGQMYSVLCASPDYLARHGVPSGPADLRRHRYLRLLDPLYQDNWTLSDEHGEYDVLPAEAFQVNVAESWRGRPRPAWASACCPPSSPASPCAKAACCGCCRNTACASATSMRSTRRGISSTRRSAPGWTSSGRTAPAVRPGRRGAGRPSALGSTEFIVALEAIVIHLPGGFPGGAGA